jgi:uncharacterized protein YjlB
MPNPADALTIEEHYFADDGRVPNNPWLPLIVYRAALETGPRCAADCEALFADNGWSGAWRNRIYAHQHYHSTAHEVLGIAAGSFGCGSAARTAQRYSCRPATSS